MGKMILQVDIFEILSLAWNHPLVTGGLILMFTPPLFPVVVFFSPLLISTALCAVALISVGHQIEASREREIAGWNARVVDGDRLSARLLHARRRAVPGEERWQDWVQGIEPGSFWNTESSLLDDIKQEGLRADFRADEGGIEFIEEDYLGRQIEAFREYERSFSFRTGAIAGIAASTSTGALEDITFPKDMIPFATEGAVTNPQIPPIFLYNLRTGGTGTQNVSQGGVQALSSAQGTSSFSAVNQAGATLLPFGSFDISDMVDVQGTRGQREFEHQPNIFETGRTTPDMQVSHVAALMNMHNVGANNTSIRMPNEPYHSLEKRGYGFTTTALGGVGDNDLIFESPVNSSVAAKPCQESVSAPSYNSSLRFGNAVIYNASSESGSAGLERYGSNRHAYRERRVSTSSRQKRRHLAREKSAKHPFLLGVRTEDDWRQMTSQAGR